MKKMKKNELRCFEKNDCIVCYYFDNLCNQLSEGCCRSVDSNCSESLLIYRLKNPNWVAIE